MELVVLIFLGVITIALVVAFTQIKKKDEHISSVQPNKPWQSIPVPNFVAHDTDYSDRLEHFLAEIRIPSYFGLEITFTRVFTRLYKDKDISYERIVAIASKAVANFFSKLPSPNPTTLFSMQLHSIFFQNDEPTKECVALFTGLAKPFRDAGLPYHRATLDAKYPRTGGDIKSHDPIDQLVANTPLHGLFSKDDFDHITIPFDIPSERWFEGTWIVAPTGEGKTNLLEHLILNFPKDASVILLDAKGELIEFFSKLKSIKDRLVILDPNPDYPLALNPFAMGAHAVELLEYLFSSLLEAGMTPLQSTLFRLTLTLVVEIPNATIEIFRDIIQNGVKKPEYEAAIRKLKPRDQDFFDKEFNSETYRKTKQEIMWRLRLLFSIDALDDMLQSKENKLDLGKLMDEGKFICINNNYDLLGDQGSEFFGRFFIALIWAEVRKRSRSTAKKTPVYIVLDEAHVVIKRDAKIATILQQCRAQKIAMIFAHQELQSIKDMDVEGALKNCAIKFMHPDTGEASKLAPFLNTDADFFKSLKQYHFACTVRHKASTPVALSVLEVKASNHPRMTQAEYDAVMVYSRRYCQGSTHQPQNPPGDDTLYWETTISPILAKTGGERVIHGCRVKIQPGTKHGVRVRLRGAGVHRPDGSRGDIILTLKVAGHRAPGQLGYDPDKTDDWDA